jgi:hypothetical protein
MYLCIVERDVPKYRLASATRMNNGVIGRTLSEGIRAIHSTMLVAIGADRNPAYSLEHRRKVVPFKNPEDFEKVIDGLRKAGLPEE